MRPTVSPARLPPPEAPSSPKPLPPRSPFHPGAPSTPKPLPPRSPSTPEHPGASTASPRRPLPWKSRTPLGCSDSNPRPPHAERTHRRKREKKKSCGTLRRRSFSSFSPPVPWPLGGAAQLGQAGGRRTGARTMWIWYLLLGSGSRTVESQLLPGNNFTTECNIPGNFMCGDGKCVPGGWQCDGVPDCFDKSDERGCPKVKSKCAPTFFACANGVHCIIGRFRCNGFSDCPDGSDEENCTGNPLVCSESRFKCRNGRCLDRSFLCNGQDNCQDNSDEELCLTTAEAPGQDFVTLDYRLRYYPSITYAVIGSAVIFVLVVALLALVLHHQRKRSVLLPRGVRGSSHHHHHHQPLLLSRLVILDRGHVHPGGPGLSPGSPTTAGQCSSTTQALQLLSGTLYPSGLSMDSPPSYSQAVLDVSRPPWFDLPPPPYLLDRELPSADELPQYEAPREPLSHQPARPTAPSAPRTGASGSQPNSREESEQL